MTRDLPEPLPSTPVEDPTHEATVRNRFCADELTVTLRVVEGRFAALGWTGRACRLCQAGATVAMDALAGQPIQNVPSLHAALDAVRSGGDAGPYAAFHTLRDHPSRESCVRLALTAVERALAPDRPDCPDNLLRLDAQTRHHRESAWSVAARWRARGLGVVIATLVDVVGSSPCPLGSHLVVASDGMFWGAVSGGCVEGAVVQSALDLLAEPGRPAGRVSTFRIANSQAGEVGLPCGGQVRIHLAVAPGDRLLRAYQRRGRGLARVLDLEGGPEQLQTTEASAPRLDGSQFVQPLLARDRLVLVGGTRVAQILSTLAGAMDFDVHVIEPRSAFAAPDRFEVPVHATDPDRALPALLSARTAVVVLTHDARIDDLALGVALTSDAFYVGALGSRKTQRQRLARLNAAGLPTDRLHGPAGVPIGAVGPEEIALSILAEVVRARRSAQPVPRVGTIVLAAGLSRRAGPVNKLLQPLEGVPLIRHTVGKVVEAGIGPCIVVLGHQAAAVQEALDGLEVTFVHNTAFAKGMGSSIAVGVEAMAAHAVTAALVVLGDMPYLDAEVLQRLATAHTPATQHLPIVPVAGVGPERRRGNPVLWPRQAFEDLSKLTGDTGGRALLRQAGGAVLEMEVAHDGVLRDVDGVLEC